MLYPNNLSAIRSKKNVNIDDMKFIYQGKPLPPLLYKAFEDGTALPEPSLAKEIAQKLGVTIGDIWKNYSELHKKKWEIKKNQSSIKQTQKTNLYFNKKSKAEQPKKNISIKSKFGNKKPIQKGKAVLKKQKSFSSQNNLQLKEKINELMSTVPGLNKKDARRIARGEITVKEYQDMVAKREEKIRIKTQATEMASKYNINLGLSYQIARKGLTYQEYLERKKEVDKFNAIPDVGRGREYFKKCIEEKIPLFFCAFENRKYVCTLKEDAKYQFHLLLEKGKEVKVHKLKFKYCCEKSVADFVKNSISINNDVKNKATKPSPYIFDRYKIPTELLKNGNNVKITLLDGDVISGTIEWESKYEICLKLKDNVSVIIFKHAVHLID